MREITATTATRCGVRKSVQTGEDWGLVHDGQTYRLFPPRTAGYGIPATHTVLLGEQAELEAEAARLQLRAADDLRPAGARREEAVRRGK